MTSLGSPGLSSQCAAVRTLAILLALQSIEWRWPGSLTCSAGWLLFSCLSPNANMNWAFFGVTFAQIIIPLFPSYAVSTQFLQKPTQQLNKMMEFLGLSGPGSSPSSSWPLLLGLLYLSFFLEFSLLSGHNPLGLFLSLGCPGPLGLPIFPGFPPFFSMHT